ncbi:MAG: SPASM domain-containing protein [Coprothermobacterota bacterium]|nr:SPASM domain-containing protein [Coprothermobacterota bacterium]
MHAFSKIEFQIKQKLEKYGFVVRPFVPQPLAAPCGAVYPFSYLIAPDGKLYKCWETIGMENESVGEIDHMGVLTPTLMKWINYDPFHQINSKGCQNCQFMPICLGGCPYLYFVWESSQQPKSECSRWKYTLREAMLWIAQRVKQNPDILQALNFKSGRG